VQVVEVMWHDTLESATLGVLPDGSKNFGWPELSYRIIVLSLSLVIVMFLVGIHKIV
jgi:hypothetical protein